MTMGILAEHCSALDLARECLYRFLASSFSDPRGETFQLAYRSENHSLAAAAADLVRNETESASVRPGLGELAADKLDLGPVIAELSRPLAELQAEYDRIFGLVPCRECPPYETEYHPSSETFFRSQQLADIAGFYRAFGLDKTTDRQDHLALELEFMAILLMKRRLALADQDSQMPTNATLCDGALRDFFRDHLAWWVPSFCTGMRRKAGASLYGALSQALAAFLPVERQHYGVASPRLPLRSDFIERPEEQPHCNDCAASHE